MVQWDQLYYSLSLGSPCSRKALCILTVTNTRGCPRDTQRSAAQVRPSYVIRFSTISFSHLTSKHASLSTRCGQKSRTNSRPSAPSHLAPASQPNKAVIKTFLQTLHHTLHLNIDINHRFRADFSKASIGMGLFVISQLTGSQLLRYHYRSTIYRDATASRPQQTLYPILDVVRNGGSFVEDVFVQWQSRCWTVSRTPTHALPAEETGD